MEFFNKKEEVLEVTLTQKGKELFATGKFKPFYYSFFDSDIIYDNGSSEEQNEIVSRIKTTPTLKQNTNVYQNDKNIFNFPKQKQSLYSELGDKTILDQYKPAWEIEFIKAPDFQFVGTNINNATDTKKYEIKLSSSFDQNNVNQIIIPQIDIQTLYKVCQLTKEPTNTDPPGTINNPFKTEKEFLDFGPFPKFNYYLDQDGVTILQAVFDEQGKFMQVVEEVGKFMPKIIEEYYLVKDNQAILNFNEFNSFENYEKQEFEIEAFYVEKDKIEELTFNKDLLNNIFQYVDILFDSAAEFDISVNTKNIYGNLVTKDESGCE